MAFIWAYSFWSQLINSKGRGKKFAILRIWKSNQKMYKVYKKDTLEKAEPRYENSVFNEIFYSRFCKLGRIQSSELVWGWDRWRWLSGAILLLQFLPKMFLENFVALLKPLYKIDGSFHSKTSPFSLKSRGQHRKNCKMRRLRLFQNIYLKLSECDSAEEAMYTMSRKKLRLDTAFRCWF